MIHVLQAIYRCKVGETCDGIVVNFSQFLRVENPKRKHQHENTNHDKFYALRWELEIWIMSLSCCSVRQKGRLGRVCYVG